MGAVLALADGFGDPASGRLISGVPSAISQVMSTSAISVRACAVVLAGEALTPRVFWPSGRRGRRRGS